MPHTLLMKFGEGTHLQSFFEEGEIYLNTLDYFRKKENDLQRTDRREGTQSQQTSIGGAVSISSSKDGPWHEFPGSNTRFQEQSTSQEVLSLNIFCLFMLSFEEDDNRNIGSLVSEEVITGFGQECVLILNPVEFMERVKEAALQRGFKVQSSPVTYKDLELHSGDVGPFVKADNFSHQNEYRVIVTDPSRCGKALTLQVGSLKDIAIRIPSNNVRNLVFKIEEVE